MSEESFNQIIIKKKKIFALNLSLIIYSILNIITAY